MGSALAVSAYPALVSAHTPHSEGSIGEIRGMVHLQQSSSTHATDDPGGTFMLSLWFVLVFMEKPLAV